MKKLTLLAFAAALATGTAWAQSNTIPVPSEKGIEAEGDSGRPAGNRANKDADERAKADKQGEQSTTGSGLRDWPKDAPNAGGKSDRDAIDNDKTPGGLTRD
jgi:hypothetical protein